jgi:valyl-tRNA synthetase
LCFHFLNVLQTLIGDILTFKSLNFKFNKDGDVLDTWFSSGLLPLSALGWKGRKGEAIPVSTI